MNIAHMITITPMSFGLGRVLPLCYRGNLYHDHRSLYQAAQSKPRMQLSGFRSRLIRYHMLWGALDDAAVEHCLYDSSHKFDIGGILYEIRQQSTGLLYYGITDCLILRLRAHILYSNRSTAFLHQQITAFGIRDFFVREVARMRCSRDDLLEMERAMIVHRDTVWPNGLNAI